MSLPAGASKYPYRHLTLPYEQFTVFHPEASYGAWRRARDRQHIEKDMFTPLEASNIPNAFSDKKVGSADWREMNELIRHTRKVREKARYSQEQGTIDLSNATEPVTLMALTDTHIGAIGSDVDILERVTEEVINEPNLLIGFLGDAVEMVINQRSIHEAAQQVLTPDQQYDYLESWLASGIADHIAFSTWGNHDTMRQQKYGGDSSVARAFGRRFIYYDGIGHLDLVVGNETYKIAASHHFRGRSLDHPCHSGVRYLMREGQDREIALAGDSHRPGIEQVVQSRSVKTAINGGTLHLESHYAKQNFSLFTSDAFPCITFYPDRHLYNVYWSLAHWRAEQRAKAPSSI